MKCNPHPDAPHGFLRNNSHNEGRYVCECEHWEEPKMNNRIKELAEQAGITMFGDAVYMSDSNDTLDVNVMNKFAELIINECASLFPLTFTDEQYSRRIDKTIRKHFEIENQDKIERDQNIRNRSTYFGVE